MLRLLLRCVVLVPAIAAFILSETLIASVTRDVRRRRWLQIRLVGFFSRIGLRIVRAQIFLRGNLPAQRGGFLLVTNHQSYLDVLVLASVLPLAFITSLEMRRRSLLGVLAGLGGSLFVHRSGVVGLRRDLALITNALREGYPVCLFPEATTSPGRTLLPFKSALMASAQDSGVAAVPACIVYSGTIAGTSDRVYFDGRKSFVKHLLSLLRIPSLRIEITFLDSIDVPRMGRQAATEQAFRLISSALSRPSE